MLRVLQAFHENENGAEAGLERILLVAFIALPLLGLLIYFRNQIGDKVEEWWKTVMDSGSAGSKYMKK